MMKRIATIICLLMIAVYAHATHIVGGSMGYTFLGNGPNNTFRYKIILTTYTDCSPTSELPLPESSVNIGIYYHNAAAPNANKVLKQALTAPLISSELITPPLPPGCSVSQATCIYKGIYEVEVLLESSTDGYHLYYERCCRNTALVNIQNASQTSTGFYAFIPPTSILNSSPVFLDDPVPLLCVNDSLFLLNSATDPDGDFLLYSFTTPYAGFADIFNPAPAPQPTLQWPVTPVTYQNNFTSTLPFGPGSYTYINALNGLSIYKTSLTGNFAVAVQISEYRNGNLISVTRRDMQLISLVCPINKPPTGTFSAGLDIQILQGDTTCFEFTYTDPDMDSVFLEVGGEPFSSIQPPIFTQQYTAPNIIHGEVCWTPPCGSARTLPYFITYKAHDDGCPPKERVNIMKITIVPDTAALFITGDTSVCMLETSNYQTNKQSGIFQWMVTNGNINPPSTTSSATVDWNLSPGQQGTITVYRDGPCRNDTASLTVQIAPPQFAGYLGDIWLCPGSSEIIEAEAGGNNYLWSPSNWLSDSTIYNPTTNTPDSLVYFVSYNDSVGCEKYDSLLVAVNDHVPVDAGENISICEGFPVTIGGNPTGPSNASFQWSAISFLFSDTVPNPSIQNPQTGGYIVEVSVDTCHARDTVSLAIWPTPDAGAGNDTSACYGFQFPLNGSGTGTISWNGDGATLTATNILDPTFIAQPGTYHPIISITSFKGCIGRDTVSIEILDLPHVRISGDVSLCKGDSALLIITGAQNYHWQSDAFLSAPFDSITYVYADSSVLVLVAATDSNGCVGYASISTSVFEANLSSTSDTILCIGDSISLSYISTSSANIYWDPSDYLSSNIGQTVISSPTADITYIAYATNQEGCTDSAIVSLSVNPLPVLEGSIQYESKLFCDYVEVKLSSDNISDSLYWLLEEYKSGSGTEATIHINPNNPETIFLIGVTQFGCIDSLAINPTYSTLEQLIPAEFPNIITPNSDLVNDEWNPPLPDGFADCMRLTVFNRWGNTVFDSNSFPIVWDGKTPAGNPLTDGVYFYVLEIGGIYKKGTVTIAR